LAPLVADEIARPVSFFEPPPPIQATSPSAAPEPYVPLHVVTYFEQDLASGEWSSPITVSLTNNYLSALSRTPLPRELTQVDAATIASASSPPQEPYFFDDQLAQDVQQ